MISRVHLVIIDCGQEPGYGPWSLLSSPGECGWLQSILNQSCVFILSLVWKTFPQAYGMTGANKVFEDDAGGEYDALLFKVDLKRDEMRFYHLQLLSFESPPQEWMHVTQSRWRFSEDDHFSQTLIRYWYVSI